MKAFRKLENCVWPDRRITIKTKLNVYEVDILFDLLYASKTWTI